MRIRTWRTWGLAVLTVLTVVFGISGETPAKDPPVWRDYVADCLETLIERGTDVYGPEKTPLLMSVIDVRTMDSPEKPDLVDSLIRFEDRLHRRGERGSNLWNDQPTLRAMYGLSRRTGDPKYAHAADAYIEYALRHCRKENGLLVWGSHIHWDCYRDRAGGDRDGEAPHEILIFLPVWEEMYRLNPEVVRQQAELIWQWHVHDKEHGRHNRHDDGRPGADFPFSGGSFVLSFAFANSVTPGDAEWLRRARLVADWHWRHRDPATNLTAFVPGVGGLYGRTFATALAGPHAVQLLRSYELTGDPHFRDIAVAYLKAYGRHGWDEEAQTYIGMLNLDGTPTTRDQVPDDMKSQLAGGEKEPDPGYSVPPIGPVDVWPTTIFPLDFPLLTAQANLYAYELTATEDGAGDEELLQAARRWARLIEQNLPPDTGATFRETLAKALPESRLTRGTYAQNYGRAISFFVHLYRATGEERYLRTAEELASEAIDKLYVKTRISLPEGSSREYAIFRGHPAKPYYEAGNGVGILLLALLELDDPDGESLGAF